MAALQHRRLPLMLELLEALEHGEQAEVHRSHVEARHFRLPYRRRRDPLGQPQGRTPGRLLGFPVRSGEHTSELQSLMRISYAVFCLKKKKQYHKNLNAQ